MSTITIAQTGSVSEVEFTEGMTVEQALAASDISVGEGRSVRVNGREAGPTATLSANDTILIVGEIRGA